MPVLSLHRGPRGSFLEMPAIRDSQLRMEAGKWWPDGSWLHLFGRPMLAEPLGTRQDTRSITQWGNKGRRPAKKAHPGARVLQAPLEGHPTPSWGVAAMDKLKHEPSWPNHKEQEEAPAERTG